MDNRHYPPPTIETYKDLSGAEVFCAERRALHDEISRKFFAEADAVYQANLTLERRNARKEARRRQIDSKHRQDSVGEPHHASVTEKPVQPVLVMLAGGPGSGKSTLTKWLKSCGVLDGPFVALTLGSFKDLPEFDEIAQTTKHPHPEKSPTLEGEYYHLRKKLFKESIAKGISMAIDDHMNNPQADAELVQMAREAGYMTILVGMTIAPYPYFHDVERLIQTKGIDHTHTPWALETHAQFAKNWETMVQNFDHAFLYQKFNSYQNPVAMLARYEKLNNGMIERTMHDEPRYQRFTEWANVNTRATSVEEAFPPRLAEEPDDYRRRMGKDAIGSGKGGKSHPDQYQHSGKEGFIERIKDASQSAVIGLS